MRVSSQKPTELYYERHELLLREAREARLALRQRVARRRAAAQKGDGRRTEGFLRKVIASWGRISIPFFGA